MVDLKWGENDQLLESVPGFLSIRVITAVLSEEETVPETRVNNISK